jgi:hypothetical protein
VHAVCDRAVVRIFPGILVRPARRRVSADQQLLLYLPAKEMTPIFCDLSVASDPDFQQLCLQACTYPCNQFNTTARINEYESTLPTNKNCPDVCASFGAGICPPQFLPYDVNCTGLCPGAEAYGWCDVVVACTLTLLGLWIGPPHT